MEIIVLLLIVGVVFVFSKLWSGGSANQSNSQPSSNNSSNNWLMYETLQSASPSDVSNTSGIADAPSSGGDSPQPDPQTTSSDWHSSGTSDPGSSGYDSTGGSSGSDGGGSGGGGGDAF